MPIGNLDPRTPVLVGAEQALTQRIGETVDLEGSLDAHELMVEAADLALHDAGGSGLTARVGWVGVPEGTWSHPDPGGARSPTRSAHRIPRPSSPKWACCSRTCSRACRLVADGATDAAIVVGGEARRRQQVAKREGVELPAQVAGPEPAARWATDDLGIADIEIERNIVNPVISYALVDHTITARHEWTDDEHHDRLGTLWGRFAEGRGREPPHVGPVGARSRHDPRAERREPDAGLPVHEAPRVAVERRPGGGRGRDLGRRSPRHGCSRGPLGVPVALGREQPLGPPGRAGAPRSLRRSGSVRLGLFPPEDRAPHVDLDVVRHVDLYSCFPAAVQVLADALGIDLVAGAPPPSPGA